MRLSSLKRIKVRNPVRTSVFCVIISVAFAGCSREQVKEIDSEIKKDWLQSNKIKSVWLGEIISQGRLLTPGKPYSLTTLTDSTEKDESLRFELRSGEYWTDIEGARSFRSEIDTKDEPAMKSQKWYRFNLLLPANFPIENNRLILAQWHGADKWWLGEPNRSPVLAFRFVNGEFSIKLMHSPERVVKDMDNVPSEKLFKTNSFLLGKWNDFVVTAKWSCEDDGFITIWWNDNQIVQYKGPVGYNDDTGPHFQFGIYRDETDKTYISYMKNVTMGNDATEVNFYLNKAKTQVN